MAGLPPYSTYRTDNKQMMYPQAISHGNVLTFTPPGFKQSLNVKFPDSRLAVCEKCKKNFKTRDMCRVRNNHTSAPWTTAYICLTLDDSCTDADGNYIDKPLTVRMVQWQPYQVKAPFDPKTPVCSACKKTNRTRSFCRDRHKHRHLPWCTVYVLLSALDAADPSTVVADPSKPVDEREDGEKEGDKDGSPANKGDGSTTATSPGEASVAESKASSIDRENVRPNKGKSGGEESDDINDIAESRTFLAKVNCQGTTIHWLELSEYEGEQPGMQQASDLNYVMIHPTDPTQAHYYHQAYAQHQNALKNHQQYYFHMQQQQHAHYAAWQQAHHYGRPHHHLHGQQSPQGSAPGGAQSEGSSSPVPVTAGEAAAQNKRSRHMAEEGNGHSSPPPPPPPHLHGQQPPPSPVTTQPQQGQQQWALYQQMYQAQLPPMGQSPHYPPRLHGTTDGGSPSLGTPGAEYPAPSTPEGNGEEHENKRQRRS